MLVKDLIEEIRIELEDTDKGQAISDGSGELLGDIRIALDDTDASGGISETESGLLACLRRNLDDPEEIGSAVSLSDIQSDVSQDVNYAYWNGGSIERYYAEGIADIVGKRPDAKDGGSVRSAFKDALSAYVLMRAFEGEIETNPESVRYQLFRKKYQEEVSSVPYHWTNDDLKKCLEHGADDIASKRSDAVISSTATGIGRIRQEFKDALEVYAAARAIERRFGKEAASDARWKVNTERYQHELNAVPYHWSDDVLNGFITDAVAEIAAKRSDARIGDGNGIESLREEYRAAVIAYAIAKAKEIRLGKEASVDPLWKVNIEKFYAELKSGEYHWSDEELLMYLNNGIKDILAVRADARMDENGDEILIGDVEAEDVFPLRPDLKGAAKSFVIYSAVERRIGIDAPKSDLWKINAKRYKTEIYGEK